MEGREWVSLGGVGHVELSEGFFGLTEFLAECIISRLFTLCIQIGLNLNGIGPILVRGEREREIGLCSKVVEEII